MENVLTNRVAGAIAEEAAANAVKPGMFDPASVIVGFVGGVASFGLGMYIGQKIKEYRANKAFEESVA